MNDIRLIDANALKEKGIKWFIDERYYHPLDKPENMSESIFSSLIDNAPTVKPYCYFCGQTEHGQIKERPQGDIRWTDKLSVKSNGDIIDFEGRVVGHINLEEMKGDTEE